MICFTIPQFSVTISSQCKLPENFLRESKKSVFCSVERFSIFFWKIIFNLLGNPFEIFAINSKFSRITFQNCLSIPPVIRNRALNCTSSNCKVLQERISYCINKLSAGNLILYVCCTLWIRNCESLNRSPAKATKFSPTFCLRQNKFHIISLVR